MRVILHRFCIALSFVLMLGSDITGQAWHRDLAGAAVLALLAIALRKERP